MCVKVTSVLICSLVSSHFINTEFCSKVMKPSCSSRGAKINLNSFVFDFFLNIVINIKK